MHVSPSSLAARVRFLRDCYRVESQGDSLLDLFARKVEQRRFLARDHLVSGELEVAPVACRDFEPLAKAARLYAREKRLVYFSLPLVARAAGDGALLCAPLVFTAASLDDGRFGDDQLALSLDGSDLRFNESAWRAWRSGEGLADPDDEEAEVAGAGDGDGDGGDELLESFFPPPPWRDAGELLAALGGVPDLDVSALAGFPALASEEELRRAVEAVRKGGGARVLPVSGLALVPRSVRTRGILFELGELATAEAFSPPVRALLGGSKPAPPVPPPAAAVSDSVPAALSRAQRTCLRSAAERELTVVVGPPGTGKSFTLAAVALDRVSRGESVLVAARNEQALAVVEEKIDSLLGVGDFALRVGRREALSRVKLRLQDLLAGRLPIEPEPRRELAAELKRLAGRLRRDAATLARLDRLEQAWGRLDAAARDDDGGWWDRVRRGWLAWRLRRQSPWWRVFGRYRDRLERYHETVARHLRATVAERLEEAVRGHRQAFSGFLAALRARRSAEQDQAFASFDFEAVLAAFPLMLTTFADAHRALPFSPGLFDLVMIDEATQCDMASALPVLERGRRALVTGDPRQLRHVSFLADRRQQALRRRHGVEDAEAGLDYRRRSLLDLALDRATSGDQVAWLDEHFRSAPAIIGFSNRTFYDGSLRVMTRRPEEVRRGALEVIQVDGRRDGEGVNAAEAAALVERLVARVAAEVELPAGRCSSLGVLSPFRAQVDHLSALVSERLSLPEIDRHRLRVGTPYGFQGDERDVMYLSLALGPDDHAAARRYLERPDVFNVSLTRARGEQVVFTSVRAKELAGEGLLRRFLEEAAHREPFGGGDQRDPFLRQVAEALAGRGFAVHAAYPIAGMEIDLLAERDGRSLGIDLVGHPGRFAPAFDLDRCQVLIRAGLAMFPLPWSAWRRDREGCLEAVEEAFPQPDARRRANVE